MLILSVGQKVYESLPKVLADLCYMLQIRYIGNLNLAGRLLIFVGCARTICGIELVAAWPLTIHSTDVLGYWRMCIEAYPSLSAVLEIYSERLQEQDRE
jgi:hypothetical protein